MKSKRHFIVFFLFLSLSLTLSGQTKKIHFTHQILYHAYEAYSDEPTEGIVILNNHLGENVALINNEFGNNSREAFYIKGDSIGKLTVDTKTQDRFFIERDSVNLFALNQNDRYKKEFELRDLNQTEVIEGLTCNLFEYRLVNSMDGFKYCIQLENSIQNSIVLETFLKMLSKDRDVILNQKGLILKFGLIKTYETQHIVLADIENISKDYTFFLQPTKKQKVLQDKEKIEWEAQDFEKP